MRNVSRILASWIVIAAVGSLVTAGDDNPFDPQSAPPAPPQATTGQSTPPSSPAMPAAPGVSLTDPISTAPKPGAFDPFANEPAPTTSQGHSSFSMRQGPATHNTVNQSGQHQSGSSGSHSVAGSPLFDEPAANSHGTPTKGSAVSTPAPFAAIAASGADAGQTPAVSAQWVKKSPIVVGQECLCDLVVRNTGKAVAKEVTVDGYFPSTVRLTHADPMPADNQDHVTWSFATLGPSEERIVHVKLVPSRRGDLSTTAVVRFAAASSNTFSVEEPLLGLAVRGPKELMVGDPATQTITVNNPGTGVAHNVAIEAHLSQGLDAPRGERLVIQVGSLNPGESRLVRLPLVATAGGEQQITIHASAGDLHRELEAKIHVIAPSVKVAVEGPNFRYVGRKAHYVVTATNDGGAPLSNIRVTHVVPEGFRFVSADQAGEFDELSRTVTWSIGHLDVHQSVPLKVDLATVRIGKCVHSVAAVAEQGSHAESQLETLVDGVASMAVEILKQSDPAEVGVETAFEIHIRNDGSKAAENVAVACEIPTVLEVTRTEGATSVAETKDQLTFRPLPLLEPGKAAIYRVHVRARGEGSHRFCVRLTADSIKDPLTYTELTKFYKD
jgi:uncharacterized repeat protein (TIGR01451 family)